MTRRADAQTRHPARDFPIERRASNLLERGIDYFAQYRRSDYYVDCISGGGRGAGVPLVERATEFKFIIDMKSATALRISSQSTLMQATLMIE